MIWLVLGGFLLSILVPMGLVLGVVLGLKMLLWWLDKAIASDDDAQPPTKTP
ncbi:hypothetical protein [Dyella sp. ASV21]|uniref:hypothetical protein n=1 Tax=Dyella sp. ASV21 TaxID=2795114 RepID=UPI0018EA629D|nr:hypothetical protein [Dyella sp. ASV21]